MKIELKRQNAPFHMEASNEAGVKIYTDGIPLEGEQARGMRPMELMLAGIGSCSSIDIVDILQKQRQGLEDIQVSVFGEREAGKVPSLFTTIHLHYVLSGSLDEEKVKRALDLSMNKYCSVAKIIEKTAEITYSYEINP